MSTRLVQKYRFFDKSKEDRIKTGRHLLGTVKRIAKKLKAVLGKSEKGKSRLKKYSKVARQKLEQLSESMAKLAPQIQYWLDTGWVAKDKLVNLLLPQVRSIPRGKVGKDVEFGFKWGITRFGGGFVYGAVDVDRGNFSDKKHVLESIDDCKRLFGEAPEAFAYDRGGWSALNVKKAKQRGVKDVAIAPAGQAKWAVTGKVLRKLRAARTMVEGSIGAFKSGRYTFNKPNARSSEMVTTCGQRSILGYNLNRMVAVDAIEKQLALVGP